jgi:mannose-6-phosphate isomerase
MGKKLPAGKKIGESWELSGVQGDLSVADNGFLKGNNLQEIVEIYMGEMVGERVFAKYGDEFPVLIKLIDAHDVLSIQVHPDDELAADRHNAYGKTEMWYVVECEPDAELYVGFNRRVSESEYLDAVAGGTVTELLNKVRVCPGDAYFIPAGTIHAIGKGLLIAEIQETSDVTYRVFDWDRVDEKGQMRELHTDLALAAIDFGEPQEYNITQKPIVNTPVKLKSCPYFTVNIIELDGSMPRNHADMDSFVIYLCVEGEYSIGRANAPAEKIAKGETVLLPADLNTVTLSGHARLLEIYM